MQFSEFQVSWVGDVNFSYDPSQCMINKNWVEKNFCLEISSRSWPFIWAQKKVFETKNLGKNSKKFVRIVFFVNLKSLKGFFCCWKSWKEERNSEKSWKIRNSKLWSSDLNRFNSCRNAEVWRYTQSKKQNSTKNTIGKDFRKRVWSFQARIQFQKKSWEWFSMGLAKEGKIQSCQKDSTQS